ncbi:malto-oligosyltrehalose trehalohydrolase [Microbacterium sp. BWT-B31]|uniref:malto-oligosyltrehalose trehalohydrolase n=1 Tax=Microbacterium sp. BWT-B31 TaxID=3232072 RepID=UPI00352829A6
MIDVWAPRAGRVRLRRPGLPDVDLARDAHRAGWWVADVALDHGDEYGFVLGEDDTLRPDPRSRWQPRGVHEASAFFDLSRFAWSDRGWAGRGLEGGLVYELHVGTFTPEGTLDAAIGRLEHLVELGVTHVELLPVNAFNGVWNWGYDGVLWFAVHHAYGGPGAYQRFVDAAHAAGLAVVQDVVYNHLGPSGNHLPAFGPYLRDAERTTWGASVQLEERNVRDTLLDNVTMWFADYHVDALRLDAVHALKDHSAVHILEELAQRADLLSAELGRPLTLIAESDLNDPTLFVRREDGGYGVTAQWNDDWHHAVHVALTGETSGYYTDFAAPNALAKVWTEGFFHDGTWSSFRGSRHGAPIPADVPTWRLVTFAQDHDQIGNRATGDRLSQTLSWDRLAVAAVLTLTAAGTPMIFHGEEWGASTPWQFFTSHPEPDLGEATAKGRIAEFARMGWGDSVVPDPQDPATFYRSKLDWSEASTGEHARLLGLYRTLARLRRERPELADSSFGSLDARVETPHETDAAHRAFRLRRGPLEVLVNLTAAARPFAVDPASEVILSTSDDALAVSAGVIVVPPDSAVIAAPGPGASRDEPRGIPS